MEKFYTVGKFAKMLGLAPQTLRDWEKSGKLIPHHKSQSGFRYYSETQYRQLTAVKMDKPRIVIGYCRVSTPSQKDDLQTQISNVKSYMCAKGYQFEIIEDIGSGINYNKKGLQYLINRVVDREVSKIVILYKDRLVRFGFELIEYLCQLNGTQIEVIDNTELSKEQELTDDLIQIITVFANRLYGQRSAKTRKLISEVMENADGEEDQAVTDSGTGDSVP